MTAMMTLWRSSILDCHNVTIADATVPHTHTTVQSADWPRNQVIGESPQHPVEHVARSLFLLLLFLGCCAAARSCRGGRIAMHPRLELGDQLAHLEHQRLLCGHFRVPQRVVWLGEAEPDAADDHPVTGVLLELWFVFDAKMLADFDHLLELWCFDGICEWDAPALRQRLLLVDVVGVDDVPPRHVRLVGTHLSHHRGHHPSYHCRIQSHRDSRIHGNSTQIGNTSLGG
mmetsp:Transcript_22531/g.55555  ORF Transcript_22531/g.55555 Transcript_22531/m.55555 type:complete len:229 (+) Transcript_22531:373-1059(+)